MKKLNKEFFLNDTLTVAKNLLGKRLVFNIDGQIKSGIITECEAYFGEDEASHGAKGKTKRNEAMFCEGGIIYIYLIYGMYYCLNFVTEKEGFASAVLIRGLYLMEPEVKNLDGPGKICKYLGLDKNYNKISVAQGDKVGIYDIGFKPKIKADIRIGISKNINKKWRFLVDENIKFANFW
jgi:DNA-3-methyladenine glycosylase